MYQDIFSTELFVPQEIFYIVLIATKWDVFLFGARQYELIIITRRISMEEERAAARCVAKCKRGKPKDEEQPSIGTVRRMMDHHACPKTRWDSAEMKNVDRRREKERVKERERGIQPESGGEATHADISDHEVWLWLCFERVSWFGILSIGTRENY